MTKIHCVKSDNYEALYVNGKLYDEGDHLNEGNERVIYFLKLCEEVGTDISYVKFGYISNDYLEYDEFPNNIEVIYDNIEWEN